MQVPLRRLILVAGAAVALTAIPLAVTESENRVSLGVSDACAQGGFCCRHEQGSLCPSSIPDGQPKGDYTPCG